jgi:hypothetical protein
MIKKFQNTFLLVAILATFTSGCASTDDYKKFADAGNKFADANNTLLDTAEKIAINTTSERVLSDRVIQGANPNAEVTKNFVARYEKEYSAPDKERLELIQELRNHNKLLQDYFAKITKLASSDSPVQTQNSVDDIAKQLQDSGSKLINFKKIGKLPSVTKIVLDARIRGAIRGELEKRKETIYQEITIQQKILRYISKSMEDDIKVTRELQETRLVLKPLLQPDSFAKLDENEWIKTRNQVMIQDDKIILTTINQASVTLGEFKEMFVASVGGEQSSKRLNKFIQETNSFSELILNKQ